MTVLPPSAWKGFAAFILISAAAAVAADVGLGLAPSSKPGYFFHQARGFYAGRLDLPGAAPDSHDLAPYEGRVYGVFGPLPALLMTPFVPFVSDFFPQRYFGQVMCALTAGFVFLLVHRASRIGGWTPACWMLAAGVAWGSSNVVFALSANHWFVGQATASPFFLAALWFALDRRPKTRGRSTVAASIAYALAIAGRFHLVFVFPVFLYLALSDEAYRWPRALAWRTAAGGRVARQALLWAAPPAAAVALLLLFNWARFDHPLDFGLVHHNMAHTFEGKFARWGGWGWGYLGQNLYYTVFRLPHMMVRDCEVCGMGFSLFAQTPLFLLAFLRSPSNAPRGLLAAAWLSAAGGFAFLMNFMGTGYWQFGARYLYDLMPLLALIIALKRPDRFPVALAFTAAASMAINVGGGLMYIDRWAPAFPTGAMASAAFFLSFALLLAANLGGWFPGLKRRFAEALSA